LTLDRTTVKAFSGRKDFLLVEPQKKRSLLPLSPRRTQFRLRPLLFPSVWPSPDVLPPPRRPFQRKSTVCGLNSWRPTLSPSLGGPLYLNPQPVSFLAALAPSDLLPRRSASASLSARKICHSNFSRSKANSKILPLTPPCLTVPRSKKDLLPMAPKRWIPPSIWGNSWFSKRR
jgi:hypothetical protein